jgi:predicted transcriptional regulator
VWKATWRSSPVAGIMGNVTVIKLSVKQIKSGSKFAKRELDEFLAEADLMRYFI